MGEKIEEKSLESEVPSGKQKEIKEPPEEKSEMIKGVFELLRRARKSASMKYLEAKIARAPEKYLKELEEKAKPLFEAEKNLRKGKWDAKLAEIVKDNSTEIEEKLKEERKKISNEIESYAGKQPWEQPKDSEELHKLGEQIKKVEDQLFKMEEKRKEWASKMYGVSEEEIKEALK